MKVYSISSPEQLAKAADLVKWDRDRRKVTDFINSWTKGYGPKDMTLDGDKIQWTEPLDNRNLECIVQLLPSGEKQRTKWISHKLVVEEPEEDWEW